jgi:hypothetical protein
MDRRRVGSVVFLLLVASCGNDDQLQPANEDRVAQETPSDGSPDQTGSVAATVQVAAIQASRAKCKEALGEFADTTELQECDFDASKAARKLVEKSNGNTLLDELWPDLFENLVYYLAGGGDALAMRVVAAAEGADFQLKRAAILTGTDVSKPAHDYSDNDVTRMLTQVSSANENSISPDALSAKWKAVRDADCAAYPVTMCSERLNATFGAMLDGIIEDQKS